MKRIQAIFLLIFMIPAMLHAALPEQALRLDREGKRQQAITEYLRLEKTPMRLSDRRTLYERLADLLTLEGRYGEAIAFQQKLLGIVTAPQLRSAVFTNLSDAYFHLGDYQRATAALDSAGIPLTDSRRANILALSGDLDKAAEILSAAAQSDALSPTERSIARQNLGFIRWEQQRIGEARSLLQDALAELPADRRPVTMANLAMVLSEGDNPDFDNAIRIVDDAIALQRKTLSDSHPDLLASLRKRAVILARAGHMREAVTAFDAFFMAERKMLLSSLAGMSAQRRLNLWTREKPLLSSCFMVAKAADPEKLMEKAIFRRSTSLLGMKTDVALDHLLNATPAAIRRKLLPGEAVAEIITHPDADGRAIYAALLLPRKGKASYIPLFPADSLPSVAGRPLADLIESGIPHDINTLYSDTTLLMRLLGPLFNALPAKTGTLYFSPEGIFHRIAVEHLAADHGDIPLMKRLSSSAELLRRGGVRRTTDNGTTLVAGGFDYNEIPADSILSPIPDRTASRSLVAAYGGNPPKQIFPYLGGTRREADSLAMIIPGANLRHTLSEEEAKRILPTLSRAHIATHGYSLTSGFRERPQFMTDSVAVDVSLLSSGIALSGANTFATDDSRDDAILSAAEISTLPLDGLRFIALSACQTALGALSDEGAAGLVRGLKNAGASTVMASLWEVDDYSTTLLMQHFYNALAEGLSHDEALRKARQTLRNDPIRVSVTPFDAATLARGKKTVTRLLPPFSEPYYNSPFIIIDDI